MEDALQLTTTVPLGLWLDQLSHIRLSMRKLMQQVGTSMTGETVRWENGPIHVVICLTG